MSTNTEFNIAKSIKPYLIDIAEKLRSGHAAVMIGAGFSKNAKPSSDNCSSFSDWSQLGDAFFEKLYGRLPKENDRYLNVLKLANEVESTFGRPALDYLLKKYIPDLEYEPSELHEKLLRLPWDDVFTTNYDTLLERVSERIFDKKYDIVINIESLIYSSKPRIIKLHGSFPAGRPFIITEEDYRKYPVDFAPFVNTVQQSLLENTLCMLGFSGDDPNFLKWIGWIRDNLGQNSPKIYLIGVLNYTQAQRRLLEDRNVVVVNMAECDSINTNDHYKGLHIFIEYLTDQKQRDPLSWPYNKSKLSPDRNVNKSDELNNIISDWKKQRESYPGWVVMPEEKRNTVWYSTESWCNFLLNNNDIEEIKDLEWGYELLWRQDKCLIPIFKNQVEFFEHVLEKYKNQFFPEIQEITDKRYTSEYKNRWLDIKIQLMRFYREEGINEKWDSCDAFFTRVWSSLDAYQKSRISYERVLYSLFRLDIAMIKEKLSAWSKNDSLPFMEAKRAMILAELGDTKEASAILVNSLDKIRSKINLKPISNNFDLISQESYIMLHHDYIQKEDIFTDPSSDELDEMKQLYEKENNVSTENADFSIPKDIHDIVMEPNEDGNSLSWEEFYAKESQREYKSFKWTLLLNRVRENRRKRERELTRYRWKTLQEFECDPWGEVKLFAKVLEQPQLEYKPVESKNGFDIGSVSKTHYMGNNNKDVLLGYSFLRFVEDSGIALRIPGVSFYKNTSKGAIERIARYSSFWATAVLFRTGDEKFVDILFGRSFLRKMPQMRADEFIDLYVNSLKKATADITKGDEFARDNFGITIAKIIPEILSRLCSKCSDESRNKLFQLLDSILKSKNRSKYGSIMQFAKRLLESFAPRDRVELVHKVLSFPIPENLSPLEQNSYRNPLLFLDINEEHLNPLEKPDKLLVGQLLAKAENPISFIRSWAITSLVQLFEWKLLDSEQEIKLGKALWEKRDLSNMPTDTIYFKFAFLAMPYPSEIDPVKIFKDYISKEKFPIQGASRNISISDKPESLCREIIGAKQFIEWEDEEILDMSNKVLEWWRADKDKVVIRRDDKSFFNIFEEFRGRFLQMTNLLALVIVPIAVKRNISDPIVKAKSIYKELSDTGCYSCKLLVSLSIHGVCDDNISLANVIKDKLLSEDASCVFDALNGMDFFTEIDLDEDIPLTVMESSVFLSEKICWRNNLYLPNALIVMMKLIRKYPVMFYNSNEISSNLLSGLKYLINETNYNTDISNSEEKLYIRQEAARLASVIYRISKDNGVEIPDIINEWKGICCMSEEFSEIKNAFLSY